MNTLTLLVTYKTKPGMAMTFVDAVTDAGLLEAIHLKQPHMQQVAAIKALYITDTTVEKLTNV